MTRSRTVPQPRKEIPMAEFTLLVMFVKFLWAMLMGALFGWL